MVSLKRSLKNILIFGDSNSWGYVDEDNGKRYESRWPIIFENNLKKEGVDCKIIEDALPGRTTNIDEYLLFLALYFISIFLYFTKIRH